MENLIEKNRDVLKTASTYYKEWNHDYWHENVSEEDILVKAFSSIDKKLDDFDDCGYDLWCMKVKAPFESKVFSDSRKAEARIGYFEQKGEGKLLDSNSPLLVFEVCRRRRFSEARDYFLKIKIWFRKS